MFVNGLPIDYSGIESENIMQLLRLCESTYVVQSLKNL